jgi:hypothetical protein
MGSQLAPPRRTQQPVPAYMRLYRHSDAQTNAAVPPEGLTCALLSPWSAQPTPGGVNPGFRAVGNRRDPTALGRLWGLRRVGHAEKYLADIRSLSATDGAVSNICAELTEQLRSARQWTPARARGVRNDLDSGKASSR